MARFEIKTPGQPMRIQASEANRWNEAARRTLDQSPNIPDLPNGKRLGYAAYVDFPNTLGRGLDAGEILQFNEDLGRTPAFYKPGSANFVRRPTVQAFAPEQTLIDDNYPIGIVADPVKDGKVGQLVVAGVAAVQIFIPEAGWGAFATPLDGDTLKMWGLSPSYPTQYPIVWRDFGSNDTKWCYILLGGGSTPRGLSTPAYTIEEITAGEGAPGSRTPGYGRVDIYGGGTNSDPSATSQYILSEWSIAIPANRWIWVSKGPTETIPPGTGDTWVIAEDCDGGTTVETPVIT